MLRILTDEEIDALFAEKKRLLGKWRERLEPRAKEGQLYRRRSFNLRGEGGSKFRIDIRDNPNSLFDFSIILSFIDVDGEKYRLTRYNGRHASAHTNKWEKKHKREKATFRNAFHIHRATERYQTDEACTIDGYAEPTDRYSSFESALDSFIRSNGFEAEGDADRPLFREEDQP